MTGLRGLVTGVLATFATTTATTTAVAGASSSRLDIIDLPIGFSPEGITLGEKWTVYVGSLLEAGSIWRGDLSTGEGEIVVSNAGGQSAGMHFDRRTGYLFVAGGSSGTARVYDTSDFRLVADIALAGTSDTLINDVIVTDAAAFFTDSFQPQLYSVPLDKDSGELQDGGNTAAVTIPLGPEFTFLEGTFNSNGIEVSDDGKTLLVVNTASGELFTVDAESGEATLVDLGGVLIHGDGLVRRQNTLWVVESTVAAGNKTQVTEVSLSADLSCGSLSPRGLMNEYFDFPSTMVRKGNSLYTVMAKFGVAPEDVASTPYEIVRTDRDGTGLICSTVGDGSSNMDD